MYFKYLVMDRQIVCFAIPAVEVALARLSHPPVRTRPLAIAPLHTTRPLLREVSREAEDAGLCHLLAPNQDYEVTGLVDEHFSTVTVTVQFLRLLSTHGFEVLAEPVTEVSA